LRQIAAPSAGTRSSTLSSPNNELVEALLFGELSDEPAAHGAALLVQLQPPDLEHRAQLQRHLVGEHLERLAEFEGHTARRAVRAGHHADQYAVVHERERQGGGLSHVPHELEVVGRHAAQLRAGQVEAARLRAEERGARARAVHDRAGELGEVQLAGLRGDVRCREVQPEVGLHLLGALLRHDLAVRVGVEVVDHHLVEAGEAPQLHGGVRPELLAGGGPGETVHRPVDRSRGYRLGVCGRRLELDQHPRIRSMHDRIELASVQGDLHRVLRGVVVVEDVAEVGLGGGAHEVGEGGAQQIGCGDAEQAVGVLTGVRDAEVVLVDHEQSAVRLDGAGGADGLERADRQALGLPGGQLADCGTHRLGPSVE
jgi:hypothetical protein